MATYCDTELLVYSIQHILSIGLNTVFQMAVPVTFIIAVLGRMQFVVDLLYAKLCAMIKI